MFCWTSVAVILREKLDIVVLVKLLNKYEYVNVSDQSSIFTHETKMLISIFWKCVLDFNELNMMRTDG